MKLTIIAIILCVSLGAKAQQDSTEMKKAIDAMQKMYSVHCKHSINSPFHSKNVILLL